MESLHGQDHSLQAGRRAPLNEAGIGGYSLGATEMWRVFEVDPTRIVYRPTINLLYSYSPMHYTRVPPFFWSFCFRIASITAQRFTS